MYLFVCVCVRACVCVCVCIIFCKHAILYQQAIFGMKPQAGGGFVGDISPSPGTSAGGYHRESVPSPTNPSYEDALSAEMATLHGAAGRQPEQGQAGEKARLLAVKEHLPMVHVPECIYTCFRGIFA